MVTAVTDSQTVLDQFHPAVQGWFKETFEAPTSIQERAWAEFANRTHTLIAAPTGSGKTLAAFLAAIDDLVQQAVAGTLSQATQILYVSPLKALSNDIEKNLQLPLRGIVIGKSENSRRKTSARKPRLTQLKK